MAQFGDRRPASFRSWTNPLGRPQAKAPDPPSPLPQAGTYGSVPPNDNPFVQTPEVTPSAAAGGQGEGVAVNPTRAEAALLSNRRNQWRQYKHMTFDMGSSANPAQPTATPPSPPGEEVRPRLTMPRLPARPRAVRPTLRSGLLPSGPADLAPASPNGTEKAPQARGVYRSSPSRFETNQGTYPETAFPQQRRPQRSGPDYGKVTPLNFSRSAASRPQGADRGGYGQSGDPVPLRSPDSRQNPTPGAPSAVAGPDQVRIRRPRAVVPNLPRAPRSVLYLMRLLILGVGVAAIAGTLLAALSPAKQDASAPEPLTAAQAPANSGRGLATGRLPHQVTDLQLSSELTRFKAQVEQLITLTPGLTPSIFALDLDSGHYLDLEGDQALPAASTIKVPILVAFLQQVDGGALALNQTLALQETQVAGGSGTLANEAVGSEYSALEVASRMIINSDNTATNMIIDALGGVEVLNQKFAEWGLTATVLRNPLPDLEGTNTTSSRDLAMLMALVDQGGLLSPRSRDRLLSIMQRTANRSLIPTGIGNQDGTIVANKTGDIATLLGDVALVDTANGHRYALALLVQRPDNDGRASELIRRLTEITHSEINQPLSPVGRPPAPVAPPLPPVGGEAPAEGAASPALEPQPALPADSPGQSGNAVPPG